MEICMFVFSVMSKKIKIDLFTGRNCLSEREGKC